MRVENLAVCLPYSQGIDVYVRIAGEHLRLWPETFDDQTISKITDPLPRPCLVVFIGRPWGSLLGEILFQQTDLCIIPERWLEHIPCWQRLQRAEFSVQLIEAHLSDPIQLFGAKNTINLQERQHHDEGC